MSVSDCSLVNFPLERKPLTYITIVLLSNTCKILQRRWKKNTVCAYLHYLSQKTGNVLHIIQTKLATLSKSEVQNSEKIQQSNSSLLWFEVLCFSEDMQALELSQKKVSRCDILKKKKIFTHIVWGQEMWDWPHSLLELKLQMSLTLWRCRRWPFPRRHMLK